MTQYFLSFHFWFVDILVLYSGCFNHMAAPTRLPVDFVLGESGKYPGVLEGEISKSPAIFQIIKNSCDLMQPIYQNLFSYFTSLSCVYSWVLLFGWPKRCLSSLSLRFWDAANFPKEQRDAVQRIVATSVDQGSIRQRATGRPATWYIWGHYDWNNGCIMQTYWTKRNHCIAIESIQPDFHMQAYENV